MVQPCRSETGLSSPVAVVQRQSEHSAPTRRLAPRGAATRERIVAATADLVRAKGAGALSLDEVMEKSGASKSQLYHYFADKGALLREAAALQARRVLGAHEPILGELDSLAALARWRDAVLALNRGEGSSSRRARLSVAARREDRPDGRRRRFRNVAGAARGRVRPDRARGELRPARATRAPSRLRS